MGIEHSKNLKKRKCSHYADGNCDYYGDEGCPYDDTDEKMCEFYEE